MTDSPDDGDLVAPAPKIAVPDDVDTSLGYWSVRVPVDYTIDDFELPGYGEWDSYIPGPQQTAWWVEEDAASGGDSYVSGGVYPVGSGLKLLTPLVPAVARPAI